MSELYISPAGDWVSGTTAKAMLSRLAFRLEVLECRDRADFIRQNWRRVAARPSDWQEFEHLADHFEEVRA